MIKRHLCLWGPLLLISVWIISGCGTENSNPRGPGAISIPCRTGESKLCNCLNGEPGVQICQDSSEGWQACQCPTVGLPPGDVISGAPEPCAVDEDADDPDSNADVGQVTKVVYPDFGVVPEGGLFQGDPFEDGEYEVYSEAITVPIVAETRNVAGLTITVTDGPVGGTAYFPEEDGNLVAGPLPLIIILPGFSASYIFYESYARHYVSHGFAVMGLDTRLNFFDASHAKEAVEVSQAINWIAAAADSPLKGRLDITKIAVSGHSKGGKVAFFAAAIDSRVDLVIGWDPSNSGGPPCYIADLLGGVMPELECNALPVAPNCETAEPGIEHYMEAESLVLGVPRDPAFNPDKHHNAIHFYRGAPSPALLVFFKGGHVDPVPMEIFGVQVFGSPAIVKFNKAIQMAFLLKRFKGMTGGDLDKWLPDNEKGITNLLAEDKSDIIIRAESK